MIWKAVLRVCGVRRVGDGCQAAENDRSAYNNEKSMVKIRKIKALD